MLNIITSPTLWLVLPVLWVYFPSLGNSFVWDDFLVVVDNPFIQSWQNLPLVFTRRYLTAPSELSSLGALNIGSGEVTYRPVVTLTYFLEYALWGLNPLGYHLTNLLLHIVNICLLYFFLKITFQEKRLAYWAALIFALHPVHTETVLVISWREELLVFLFIVAGLICFRQSCSAASSGRVSAKAMSLFFYALALFAKEMAITFPLLLLLWDFFRICGQGRQGKFWSLVVGRHKEFWGITLFYLWIRFGVMASPSEYATHYVGNSFYTTALTMAGVLVRYLGWLVVPPEVFVMRLGPEMILSSLFDVRARVSVASVVALLVVALRLWKSGQRMLSFGLLWFFTALLPVMNIIPLQNVLAYHYLYLPSLGICLMMGSVVDRVLSSNFAVNRFVRMGMAVGMGMLLVFYGTMTFRRNFSFKDEITFRQEMVQNYPEDIALRRSLSGAFLRDGRLPEAAEELRAAQKLDPDNPRLLMDLGVIYEGQRNFEAAQEQFRRAVVLNPQLDYAFNALCLSLAKQRRDREVEQCFKEFLEKNPQSFTAHYNFGVFYLQQNKPEQAVLFLREAQGLNPQEPNVQRMLQGLGE